MGQRPKLNSIEHARAVREARSRHMKKLEGGFSSLREVLTNPPDYLLGVDIWVLLKAPPGMGPATARRVCERAHMWPHTPVGECSKLEMQLILKHLPERVK